MTEIAIPTEYPKGVAAVDQARSMVVADADDYALADAFCVGLKALEKEIDATFDDAIKKAHETHRALTGKKKQFAEPIDAARKMVKAKMAAWQDEEERKRAELEDKLRAEAQKQAEDAALAAAAAAEKSGDRAAAEEIIQTPVYVPAVMLEKAAPKAQTTFQTRWDFHFVDAKGNQITEEQAEKLRLVPPEFWVLNRTQILKVVTAMKSSTNVPGILAYSKKV